jgi:hypothetical protein
VPSDRPFLVFPRGGCWFLTLFVRRWGPVSLAVGISPVRRLGRFPAVFLGVQTSGCRWLSVVVVGLQCFYSTFADAFLVIASRLRRLTVGVCSPGDRLQRFQD